ncbi:hypothetical protein HZC33_00845 [Candidatus Wolfebacteria bacterium]|nr:hypothetical protein [Candidatus Wolfebacteria bacterium]
MKNFILNMSLINKILFALVVVLMIALVGVIYWQKNGFEDPYYAVYLNTGDLYFGHVNWFPRFSLSGAYLLQKTNDEKNPYNITKFGNAFWGPEDDLYLNYDNVVWKTRLKKDSPVIGYIKAMDAKIASGQEQISSQPVQSTSTSPKNK